MKLANGVELKKGSWSPEEDQKLIAYVNKYGPKNWCQVTKGAGLARSGKSCRLRWVNYLKPDLKGGRLTADEIDTIIKLHKSLGNKWTHIASQLPGRTDNEIKNFWHLNMKKYNKTVVTKNHHKSNQTKRGNRKVNEEENDWVSSYGSDELYSQINLSRSSSSIISDFPIAESYSPSKDYSSIISPLASQVEDSVEFISSMLEIDFEDVCIPTHQRMDFPNSTPSSEFNESSFWFDILMDAERLGANDGRKRQL